MYLKNTRLRPWKAITRQPKEKKTTDKKNRQVGLESQHENLTQLKQHYGRLSTQAAETPTPDHHRSPYRNTTTQEI
jgi:hypothetical protein